MAEVSVFGEHTDSQFEEISSVSSHVVHYKKIDVHAAIDANNKGYLVYVYKDHDMIMEMLSNYEIPHTKAAPQSLNDLYCEFELPEVSPDNLMKALSDVENRTRIEEKMVNGKKVFCRLTKVRDNASSCGGEIQSIGRVLSSREIELLQEVTAISQMNAASQHV